MATRKKTPGPGAKIGSNSKARQKVVTDPAVATDTPVVAIGASAGGLEPIGRLLAEMPVDSGLAFVVIQHLDPTSKSLLPELLGRRTALKVQPASEGIRLMPNEVYVIPPGEYLSISSGKLHLSPTQTGEGARMPIDLFLRSLAAERSNRGIGIIMSGTGTDGAEGLKALKEAGGLALVQDPGEAQHDGMPRNAVTMARPDYVLRVGDMPLVLSRYVAHNYVKAHQPSTSAAEPDAAGQLPLRAFIDLLKSSTGKDFGLYKPGTLQRRIERRMALNGVQGWTDYLALLRKSPAETDALARDLLINVTGFFRDPEAFAALIDPLTDLLRRHAADQPVRVWVAGCSTGEEAYSLGILLLEEIAASGRRLGLQVFATDIDDEAVEIGRAGIYPESIQADLSQTRLKQFFVQENGHFRVTKQLREAVIFSRHDVLQDPPFSRLDLVSCRNLLIYLVPEAQRHVLQMLHFALLDSGLLLLGSAESVTSGPVLFEPIDEKLNIYRRRDHNRSTRARFSMLGRGIGSDKSSQVARPAISRPLSLPEIVQRMMLQSYAPAAVVTDRQFTPLYYLGGVGRYLEIVAGEPNQDLLSIAREGLRAKLRETIMRAFREKRRIAMHGVWLSRDGKAGTVTIDAQPVPDNNDALVLASFIDELPEKKGAGARAGRKAGDRSELALLQRQLTETRRELNRTINELREANEELKAKNEESASLNEEFLSTNEELESSKEELQSLNEELTTINNQLRQTLEIQQQTSTDLANLLDSSPVATILLDAKLCIKAFNPRMRELFSLIDTDVGRPLADLVPQFADPQLPAEALAARSAGTPSEREIRSESGMWYLRSVLPYRTETGDIEGAVITFADVSTLKQAELAAAAARRYAETIVDTVRDPLVVLDSNVKIVSANAAFCVAFDLPPDRVTGQVLRDLGRPTLSQAPLVDLIARLRAQQEGADNAELEVEDAGGGHRIWLANVRSFRVLPSEGPMILLALNDITAERHIVRGQLQLLIDTMPEAVLAVDKQRHIRFVSKQVESLFGYGAAELIGQTVDMLVPPETPDRHAVLQAGFFANPTARPTASGLEINGMTKDGHKIPLDIGLSPVTTADGFLVIAAIHDLRMLKQGEVQLREAKVAAERANRAKSRFLAAASHDLRQPVQTISLLHDVLRKRVADPEARTTLAKLDDAVAYMAELLDSLLDVNQIESGRITPEFTTFRIAPLLHHAANDFAPLAAAKGLRLRIVPSSVMVQSDRRLLARIIGNLLSNAIKYTDRGKILLGCRRKGDTLRIEIWDTGIGIPAESIETIFEEFYRVDRADAAKLGLGLGLYIVQRFAQLLGHTVEARSAPGKGTMFAVVISSVDFAATAPEGNGREGEAAESDPAILLVEEDPVQLDTMRTLLEFEGYSVTTARKGDEALARLRESAVVRPNIIITDYNLPGGMTGLDVVRRVREKWGADIPALIVSGERPSAELSATEGSGFIFLTKPVKSADLMAATGALVRRSVPAWRQINPSSMRTAVLPSVPLSSSDIAIVDDEPGVRDALRAILDAEGYKVETYASAEAFLSDANHDRFRCLVADLMLPGMDGLELQNRLKLEQRSPPIIFVTGRGDLSIAVKAMRQGAADFLQKPVHSAALRESIARILDQGAQTINRQAERENIAVRLATLTERERQVMERIVAGQLNKNIAAELGISQRTTEHHRQSVFRKMGERSLAMLVRMVDKQDGNS